MNFEVIQIRLSAEGVWQDLGRVAESAAAHLDAGGLLGHPTLGVYGLGGRRGRECGAAVAGLKGRPAGRGLVHLVSDKDVARTEFGDAEWSPVADKLAAEFWPGPLTLVLPNGTSDGIAIRAEGHPVTSAVLKHWGRSMSSTSLNRTGERPARTGDEAKAILSAMPEGELPVLLIDVGDLGQSPPSTLVRPTRDSFEILRPGAVPVSDLERVLA